MFEGIQYDIEYCNEVLYECFLGDIFSSQNRIRMNTLKAQ